jgi:hypothetical protein
LAKSSDNVVSTLSELLEKTARFCFKQDLLERGFERILNGMGAHPDADSSETDADHDMVLPRSQMKKC